MRTPSALGWIAALAFSGAALADDPAPIGPGDPTWAMRSLLGYSKTSGNTDNTAGNFLFHVAHVIDNWKLLFGVEGLYGSTHGETTAQAWDVHGQVNYNFTPKFYWYIGASHADDRFSGFAYQDAVKSGAGYQFFNSDATKLSVQAGVGYLWLRKEYLVKDDLGGVSERLDYDPNTGIPFDAEHNVAFDGAINFVHSFNEHTKLLAGVTVLSSTDNTLTNANIALQVKMTNRLALAAGYQLTDNSKPPPGSGRRDTLTTLNLVYELKNDKLAPD
jgi:putative salt-induced outer membrane protein YdiY